MEERSFLRKVSSTILNALDSKSIKYLDKIKTKYDSPVILLYVDSHGTDTTEKISSLKSAKVLSIAGIFGAVAFAERVPTNIPDEKILNSKRDMKIAKSFISDETNTYNIEDVFDTISKELKKETIETYDNIIKDTLDTSNLDYFEKIELDLVTRGMNSELVGDIVYQMHNKIFSFVIDPNKRHTTNLFDFGIYVLDIIFPESWKRSNISYIQELSTKLKLLINLNLISNDFVENDLYKSLFYSTIEYLQTLRDTEIADGNTIFEDGVFLNKISYIELTKLIETLGFNYIYLIDSSCRACYEALGDVGNIIYQERENPNILQMVYTKAKSTSPITRKIRYDSYPKTRKLQNSSKTFKPLQNNKRIDTKHLYDSIARIIDEFIFDNNLTVDYDFDKDSNTIILTIFGGSKKLFEVIITLNNLSHGTFKIINVTITSDDTQGQAQKHIIDAYKNYFLTLKNKRI